MLITQYTDDWRLLASLTAEWPYLQEEVYTALENEEYFGNSERTYCHDIKSPILKSIYDTVIASVPKLLAEMSEFTEFQSHWGLDYKEQIINNTKTSCYFICDKPGFSTGTHIDNKTQVCTGMLFFNSTDDVEHSTTFYTSPSGDNPVRISSKYGNGWYAANTYSNYHIGANTSLRNRYSMIFINKLDLK